ncbi:MULTISPECIES: carbohydrate ABC transporter permease [unclassified Oceanispirochaeta]|uniref:carbohydrate ABC transporter permease n=1 Tax=unclassified Oceanispirochaeta TaxID=2635722 RepID=UPI000E09A504|nr:MULTISPECIES: sugar ABC transporter permease [unclassified Oceanispirochaeta]MBF9016902.1 sugar ABC transporter permease [Oceanispirochaeta sp. M2]NPD73265.1 sugar ABC transporter permease [Oceanispirochaeta sp. M1]RDG31131.1 sugar ABC transporter permease [Oceanispirochaeta sp. M1]
MKHHDTPFCLAFLAPAFLLYSVLMILPIFLSAGYGFFSWNAIGAKTFVGLQNYRELLSDPDYWITFKNTAVLIAASLIFQLPIAFLVSFILHGMGKKSEIYRTIYFFPVVISPIAIGTLFALLYNGELGPLNSLLELLMGPEGRRNWLSDSDLVLGSVIAPDVWRYIGYYIVIFYAGLQGIPSSLYESALIDGASKKTVFFRIIIPLLTHVIQICFILSVTGCLKSFALPLALTDGGPGVRSSYLSLYMFKTAFSHHRFGYGSAVTMTILIYALGLTAILKRAFPRETAEY